MQKDVNATRAPGFALEKRSKWKHYIYSIIAAEISATTRFCDRCVQMAPSSYDTGLLFEAIRCKSKGIEESAESVEDHSQQKKNRTAFFYNGNFNYSTDIEKELKQLKPKLSRHSRIFVVSYNPFMKLLYKVADWLGIRSAPLPSNFITNNALQNIARLAGYEIIRVRPSVFVPLQIPFLSTLLNKVLPILPLIRRMALVWVVVLRPIIPEKSKPSLSIVIPARNEAGNIDNAIQRLKGFTDAELEVIFVEGGSSDDTWERIQNLVNQPSKPFAIKAFKQQGKGKYDAVRLGFEKAENEVITILDADLTMPPEQLSRFYEAYCHGLGDFINGNRLLYQMEDEAMRPLNHFGNIFFAKALAWELGLKIGDSLCGTKMLTRHDWDRLVEWRSYFGDFDPFGDFEMLFVASELALGVQDLPIHYKARSYGETQISRFRDGLKLLRMTLTGFFHIFLGKTR